MSMKTVSKTFSNRYELKYLLDLPSYYKIRKEIEPVFKRDSFAGKTGKYTVLSTYYDTPQLDFFWQKIEGEELRIKVRLRRYVDGAEGNGDEEEQKKENNVFLEIKKKENKTTGKKRILINEQRAHRFLCNPSLDANFIKLLDAQGVEALKDVMSEVMFFHGIKQLQPALLISYAREPFVSKDGLPVRITFDSNIRYRQKDLSLSVKNTDKHVLLPSHVIMEIKYTDYFPQWLIQIIQKNKCQVQTFSKYGIAMEQFLAEQSKKKQILQVGE